MNAKDEERIRRTRAEIMKFGMPAIHKMALEENETRDKLGKRASQS